MYFFTRYAPTLIHTETSKQKKEQIAENGAWMSKKEPGSKIQRARPMQSGNDLQDGFSGQRFDQGDSEAACPVSGVENGDYWR